MNNERLQSAVPFGLTPAHHKEYDTIAHLDDCARKQANKKCRKLRVGALEFSDSLKIARGTIDVWDLLLRKRNGIGASTKKIRCLMRLTGNMTAFEHSISTILTRRKTAMSSYKALKKKVGPGKDYLWQTPHKSKGKRTQYYIRGSSHLTQERFQPKKISATSKTPYRQATRSPTTICQCSC
jgi:hypothetical protein